MMRHLNSYPSRLILAIVGQKEQITKIEKNYGKERNNHSE